MVHPSLIDSFGRSQHYLRISLTDKCNFRCTYCMPKEDMVFMPADRHMSASEIVALANIFTDLGVKKIRLTGGEPTLRKDLPEILDGLSQLPVELTLTTNGYQLVPILPMLYNAGMKSLNISLDTLQKERFHQLTRRDKLDDVLSSISAAVASGLQVKINAVVMRGENADEIVDMIRWAASSKVEMRFIEYMPFFGNDWEYEKVYRKSEILKDIQQVWDIEPVMMPQDSTASVFRLNELNSRFGIISTISQPFCNGCSRIRLTADGKVKNCLFSNEEFDLLQAFRNGEDVVAMISNVVRQKKAAAAGKINFTDELARVDYAKNRAMVSIGG